MGKHSREGRRRHVTLLAGLSSLLGLVSVGAYSMASQTLRGAPDAAKTEETTLRIPTVDPLPPLKLTKADKPEGKKPVPKRAARSKAKPKPTAAKRAVKRRSMIKPAPPAKKKTALPANAPGTAGLVAYLHAQIGKAYLLGGVGPLSFDCSGLVQTAYTRLGVSLPRTSQEQSLVGRRVPLSSLRVGDLLFWGSPGSATHVAVYVGGGNYIGAENPRVGVVLQSLSYWPPDFARRIL